MWGARQGNLPPSRSHRARMLAGGFAITVLVLAFSRMWRDGRTTLDGNGVNLYVDIALHYWRSSGHVPYWVPDLWSGAPVWALAPIFPVLLLLPLAAWLGPEHAVRVATLGFQIAGGWGAMVLAASLWREEDRGRRMTAVVPDAAAMAAGCMYALDPIVISHGAFFGHETSIGVMAVTPWLVWSLRRALRGDGARWVVTSGLLAAFAILHQAEHAYGLVLVCALVALGQVASGVRSVGGWGPSLAGGWRGAPGRVARRMAWRSTGVVVVVGGAIAHWVLPLASVGQAFVLSPPDVLQGSLASSGTGGQLASEPGYFLTRSPGLATAVTYTHPDLLRSGSFYLGWVWVAGTMVALAILAVRPRRDRDATLAALLLASAVGLWMSTAATPFADSGPARRAEWPVLAAVGLVAGLCAGVYLARAAPRRWVVGLGVLAALAIVGVPFVTPFLVLQRAAPFAGALRFPRLYTVAALGLSLGAAYPLSLLGGRTSSSSRREPSVAWWARLPSPTATVALATAVGLVALALVDVWPYRAFYRTRPAADARAYAHAANRPPADGGRVITTQFGDPRIVLDLYRSGHPQTTGWPHPVAQHVLWDLVVTPPLAAPNGYRDAAAALAGSRYQATETDSYSHRPGVSQAVARAQESDPHTPAPKVRKVTYAAIPGALPVVRSYDHAVIVGGGGASAATELAVDLVPDHVSVVTGGAAAVSDLGQVAMGGAVQPSTCATDGGEDGGPVLRGELAAACAVHRWVGRYLGLQLRRIGPGVGAVFQAGVGLRALDVWLDGDAGAARLVLRPASPAGVLGPPLATVLPHPVDSTGLTPFRLPAGLPPGRYGFQLTCPGCGSDAGPRLFFTTTQHGDGDLVTGDSLATDRVAAFTPVYDGMAPAVPSSSQVTTVGRAAGRWDIDVRAGRPQLVVVAESNFPGWQATVDGHRSPVLTADGAFLGAAVPAGRHRLALRYVPPEAVGVGNALTGATLVVCALVLALPRRPRRHARALRHVAARLLRSAAALRELGRGTPGGLRSG